MTRTLGADPSQTRYVAHSGGGEANAAILSGSVDVGITGLSEIVDQVEGGKMRLLAVSTPVDAGDRRDQAADDQGRGHRPRDDQLARDRRAARHLGLRARAHRDVGQGRARERRLGRERRALRLDPLVKTGKELDDFIASEQQRVQGIVDDLGLNE